MNIDKDKLIEMATSSGILDTVLIGREEYYNFSHEELFKFADLVSAHAIALQSEVRSMQAEQEPYAYALDLGDGEVLMPNAGRDYSDNNNYKVTKLYDHPAPVTSMQESISEKCTSEPLKIAMDALKFYADKSSYDCDHDIGMEVSHRVILYKDQYEHNQQTYYAGKRAIEALEAIDSQLSTNGWVSVDERLPKCKFECTTSGTEVSQSLMITGLSDTGGEGVGYGHYHDNGEWTCYKSEHDFFNINKVTHWKEIPTLPINAISQPKGE